MKACCVLLFALALLGEEPAPLGIVRGTLVSIEAGNPQGELVIRSPEQKTFRFAFDTRTYIERERRRAPLASLKAGETMEILSDLGATPETRYARIVHVFDPNAPRRPALPQWRTNYRNPTESIVPRGNLTFSGVLRNVRSDQLVLRTRLDGDKTILLRADTRYLKSGEAVESSALENNARVYVRAGRNMDGEIEAYQVVWGEIFSPGRQ
jgi:hypothetical protein